jgi:biopolymer transport protein ExbD
VRPRERRRVHYTPDLTSLLDVLFIIVFVALIRASAAKQVAAEPAPEPLPPQPPPPPAEVVQLRAAALANLTADLGGRAPLVVRVDAEGKITALETGTDKRTLDVPLLEISSDPDAAIAYLGDRSAELRVCRIAAVHLGVPDLTKHLVIVAPAVPLADLKRALHRGLHDDLLRCLAEQHGIATIVDPANLPKP